MREPRNVYKRHMSTKGQGNRFFSFFLPQHKIPSIPDTQPLTLCYYFFSMLKKAAEGQATMKADKLVMCCSRKRMKRWMSDKKRRSVTHESWYPGTFETLNLNNNTLTFIPIHLQFPYLVVRLKRGGGTGKGRGESGIKVKWPSDVVFSKHVRW